MYDDIRKNKIKTGIIVAIFMAMISCIIYSLCYLLGYSEIALFVALIFSIISTIATYYNCDKIVLASVNARPATKEEDLQLTNILQKIKGSVNFKENKKIYRTIKKHYNDNVYNILKNKYISKNKKIMCVLIYLNCFNIIKIVKMFFNR